MAKKSDVILLGLLVGLFLVVASWPYLSYHADSPTGAVTGNSIKEAIGTFYETSSINQRIFILSQIILLIIIIIAVFVIIKKVRSKGNLVKRDYITNGENRRSRTDLDILYEMLKKKKEIGMESVEQAFRVKPEIALEWFKVLENGELAEINYPRFGKPVLSLPEEEKVEEKVEEKIDKKNNVSTKRISAKKAINKRNAPEKKTTKRKVVKRKVVKRKVVKRKSKAKRKVVKRKTTKRKR